MSGDARRMLIVEDEPLMGSLLADVLVGHNFLVETAEDVVQARAAIREFDPDGILLDISLGDGPSGLDLARVLSRQRPDIAIVFLTKHPDPRTAGLEAEDIPEGCGFLRKDRVRDTEYLLASIEAVMTDRSREARHDRDSGKPLEALSFKHIEVLRLMATGYTNEHIARVKGVALSTVERWTAEIFRDLGIDGKGGVNPRVEAVRQFIAAAGIPEKL
jgi:DNA-binding NarL/FixJ family response regulator